MPEGIGYPGQQQNGGPIAQQIMTNFRKLPPQEQEQLRALNARPDVQAYVSIIQKVFPQEVLEGVPGLGTPAQSAQQGAPQGAPPQGLLSQSV